MRLAFVSPLPPSPTGIADYTMDVARALQGAHEIDLFHDQAHVDPSPRPGTFRIADLTSRAASYDAVVYQMGNAPAHDFIYPWMDRVPGAVVLHDLVMHHSFARRYLESPEARAYASDPGDDGKRREAVKANRPYLEAIEGAYPGQGERLRDAHFNTAGDLLPYAFPLFEPALARARAVGAHNAFMVEAIQTSRPDLSCVSLAMPVEATPVSPVAVSAFRDRFGLRGGDLVIGCFGLITREKRIETVARAVSRVGQIHPSVRLLLAGEVNDPSWLRGVLERTGVSGRTIVAGRLEADAFVAAMEAAHAVVHLRHPTARETSAALLRVMAQGRPVIISDIANQSEIPEDAARRVDPADEEGDLTRAIEWMLTNPEAARALGEKARRHTQTAHAGIRTLQTYEQLLKPLASHYSRGLK